jgi:hypothetical protein
LQIISLIHVYGSRLTDENWRGEGGGRQRFAALVHGHSLIVRQQIVIIGNHLRWGQLLALRSLEIRGFPPFAKNAKDGAPGSGVEGSAVAFQPMNETLFTPTSCPL